MIFFGKYALIADFSMKLKMIKYINTLWENNSQLIQDTIKKRP